MMQVENEYGYYGDDTEYLETMKQIMIDFVLLYLLLHQMDLCMSLFPVVT